MKRFLIILLIIFITTVSLVANEFLIPFTLNDKIGFVDENLHCVLEPQYVGTVESSSKLMVLLDCKGYDVLIGNNGQLLTRGADRIVIVDENRYAVSQRGGSGFFRLYSSTDKSVLGFYDKLEIESSNKTGSLVINDIEYKYGARLNVLDENGAVLFKNNTFKRIFGYDSEKKIALIQDADFDDCLVSITGKIINQNTFRFGMRSFNEGLVFGKNLKTGECGFYDMNLNLVIKAGQKSDSTGEDWDCYPSVNCGVVALVNDGSQNILLSEWQSLHSDNWSLVDSRGQILASGLTADYIYPFSDDVAVLLVKTNNKWNYSLIDKKGNFITSEIYDKIHSSVNGYCMAQKDGVDYLIRSKDGQVFKCADFR